MSALDLDALERLTRAYADAHAAMLADDRSAQAWLDDEAASKALAAHYGGQWASPAQCVDVLALITRLRAAEARTAWQPIETAPLWPDRSPTPLWIVGQRVARPPVTVAQTAPGVYVDEYSNRQHVTAWAPLPAAPEAP